jgi:hypothetical protein
MQLKGRLGLQAENKLLRGSQEVAGIHRASGFFAGCSLDLSSWISS